MKEKFGTLTLIPTSVTEEGSLTAELKSLLTEAWQNGAGICVEDEKPGRRRWLSWGLPREAIEDFITYNEHTRDSLDGDIASQLQRGRNFFLLSDGGTPGFCDPGRSLIYLCHQRKVPVRMINCANSLLPAVSLSGFTEGAFEFLGFPPKEKEDRSVFFSEMFKKNTCQVFMDTPYRLKRVLQEMAEACPKNQMSREHFLLMDIERPSEEYLWGPLDKLLGQKDLGKREFVWVLAPKSV